MAPKMKNGINETKNAANDIKSIGSFGLNKIFQGDALKLLQQIPDKSIDMVLADPPYNLSKGSQINFNNQGLKGFGGEWTKVMQNWDNMPFSDYLNFSLNWISQIKRILKPTGSAWVFGTYHNIGIVNLVFQVLGIEIINEVVWYKRNAFPNLAGRRLTASHETLLWGHVGDKKREYFFDYQKSKEYKDSSDLMKMAGKQMRTVWDIPNNKEAREIKYGKHPTQKPLSVCRRIISIASKPGDIVLSPFAGAGSECVAAKELKRNFIGFELDSQYITIANRRLAVIDETHTLFS